MSEREALHEQDLEKHLEFVSKLHQGDIFVQIHEYEKAKQYYELYMSRCGTKHDMKTITAYISYAQLCKTLGDHSKAINLLTISLEKVTSEKVRLSEHKWLADSVSCLYKSIAEAHEGLGEYQKALEFYYKAMGAEKSLHGESTYPLLFIYSNLARLYSLLKNKTEAMKFWFLALNLAEIFLEKQSNTMAMLLNDFAESCTIFGESQLTLKLLTDSLKDIRAVNGDQDIHTAVALARLAEAYRNTKNYTKSLELYYKVMQVFEKIYGPQHEKVADVLINVAVTHAELGEFNKAIELSWKGFNIMRLTLNEGHPNFCANLS